MTEVRYKGSTPAAGMDWPAVSGAAQARGSSAGRLSDGADPRTGRTAPTPPAMRVVPALHPKTGAPAPQHKEALPPDIEAALRKVPADDRDSVRALVEALAKQGAPRDLLAWHIARATPGEKLPKVSRKERRRAAAPPLITPAVQRGLPGRIEKALAALTPEGRARVEAFAREMALAGADEQAIAWQIARHLGVAPDIDPRTGKRRRQRRALRDPYMTTPRQVLLARIAIQAGRTCDVALAAHVEWRTVYRGIVGLAKRGYIASHEDEAGHKVWAVTKRGTAWLNRLPEIEQGKAEGPVQALFLIEERADLRVELKKLGWNYDQCRDVVPHQTIDHLTRQLHEVVHLHQVGQVYNPGGLLWWRLGIVSQSTRRAKMLSGLVPKEARIRFVAEGIKLGEEQQKALRLAGLASSVVPDGLGGVFLEVVKSEPFAIGRRLAYTLRKQARSGRMMKVTDVHETLHWIRKELAARRRPTPQQLGEARE